MNGIVVGNVCSLRAMVSDSVSATREKREQIPGIQIIIRFFFGAGIPKRKKCLRGRARAFFLFLSAAASYKPSGGIRACARSGGDRAQNTGKRRDLAAKTAIFVDKQPDFSIYLYMR